jgi:SAM-dependent methyltransferase
MLSSLGSLLVSLAKVLGFYAVLVVIVIALHFPMGVDTEVLPASTVDKADDYYETVYTAPDEGGNSSYVDKGQLVAEHENIAPRLKSFLDQFQLQQAHTLEVGAGSGTLQDLVEDYTGLDIAASAARYFHKPFVHGSATDLPFRDSEFDLCWTIWTLEHVPNPEVALKEMRRVVRDGGYLYLLPAWNNPTWAPHAYPFRPNSDLTSWEVLIKYSLYVREQPWFRAMHEYPIRAARLATAALAAPSRLRYHKIDANFETYPMPDADAVNSIDCYEAELWYRSRGDEILDVESRGLGIGHECGPVVVKVHKQEQPRTASERRTGDPHPGKASTESMR